jgi:hypothetical protein
LPKVELKPVDETTPVFKNFYISNVHCAGAATGIFVRGLPEMHVKDIVLENLTLQADKGFDIQEASNMVFRNITMLSKQTNPVIDIVQSDNLLFENIQYAANSTLLFRVSGERCNTILVKKTNVGLAANKASFELGATDKMINIQ